MVKGIHNFAEYFKEHQGTYIIIGGTACEIIINKAELEPRRTKDIDIIIIIEALTNAFVNRFWEFVNDAGYTTKQVNQTERKHYRFTHPTNEDFPFQIELFSRRPDIFEGSEISKLTKLPTTEDLSSLSAILMDDTYYNLTIQNSQIENGLHYAGIESLICLKAKAFLDINGRKIKGEIVDNSDIKKHRNDVFRLGMLLPNDGFFTLSETVKKDLSDFLNDVNDNLPPDDIYRKMGNTRSLSIEIYSNLKRYFQV